MATQNESLEDAEKYWKNKEPKLWNPKKYSGVSTEWLAWKDLKNENKHAKTMGKYKRIKAKPKKQKRFANVKMILDLIREHKDKIENLPATTIQIEKRDIEWGDEWDSETGYEYLISFADKSAYLVGETKIIEDREDYAQADSWMQQYCLDYYQERGISALEVLEKLEDVVL